MPTHTHTHTPSIERDRGSPDFPPTEADLDGRIPDLDSLLVTDSEGEEDPAPAEEHPVDTLHEAVATACVVLGTSLSELGTSAGQVEADRGELVPAPSTGPASGSEP